MNKETAQKIKELIEIWRQSRIRGKDVQTALIAIIAFIEGYIEKILES